ncbi:MAG TPA: YitT family protein [Clostridia bacterium]|nr:YitT family protein [Clostridia bacterium]
MKEKNEKKIKIVIDYLSITIGTALLALSIYLFLSPNIIAPGGVTGLAVVIKKVFGYKIFITNLVINIPLFLIGVFILGRDSGAKTAFGTLSLSFFLLYFETNFPGVFATNDILLASIFGGVLSGVGIGLVFRSGGTTGGTDLLGAILNNYIPFISVPKLMMIVDLMVVITAGIVNRSVETSLYSIITLYLIVKVADFIIEGLDYTKMFYIISSNPEEISSALIKELGRGVTSLKGKGKYTDTDKEVLLCVVYRGQMVKAKEIIYEIDHNAFVMISTTHEVLGEGFRK